jgi:biotin synthase
MLPTVLLPATTALGTLATDGRERGILSGANVVMPNLSPTGVRDKYTLYNGKLYSDSESADALSDLEARLQKIGYHIEYSKGDANGKRILRLPSGNTAAGYNQFLERMD